MRTGECDPAFAGSSSKATTTNPKDLEGMKKPPLRLFPPAAVIYGSRVMELGAAKYGPYNWREKHVKHSVYLEAALRHIYQALDGAGSDPESGMPHEAHALACMAILLDARANGNLIDDLPIPGPASRAIADLTKRDTPEELTPMEKENLLSREDQLAALPHP